MQYHIAKSGGIKKALKELKENTAWITSIKSKATGKKETKRPEIMEIATAFYSKLYDDVDCTNIQWQREDEEPILSILENEIRNAILSQKKNYKAPEDDGISNEILTNELIPQQWTSSTIVLLHKKGDRTEINNYRSISLISNLYKTFSKVIGNKQNRCRVGRKSAERTGGIQKRLFNNGPYSCRKASYPKKQRVRKTYYLAFVDYNKAFDSLKHTFGTLYIHKKKKEVRQGDPLSPKLFSAVLEHVFRRIDWDGFRINING
ncbi:RNA-directed DNA polymerase from mobile element jockey [Eumeta japonica]|uniref:RNA-directed DNA polymerase from mobile element jockey n=1 Tax=Eumeta variegata TaxID=151549 RepID=A0A4C1U655_EUMVA|nr:RNA-directed DNA polymerase from mobile element jockey [Eumeta japonica]